MNNNRKKYVPVNNHTSSDQIFALLKVTLKIMFKVMRKKISKSS